MSTPPETSVRRPLDDRATLWFLRALDQPARSNRVHDWLVLTLITLAIGVIDFHVGVFFSLQPLYLIPIVLAVIWCGWTESILISLASFVIRYGADFTKGAVYPHPLTSLWNRIVAVILYVVIVWIFDILVRLHRDLEGRIKDRTTALEKALHELTSLQKDVLAVGRRERSSIGHELHDGLGQHLTATALAAELVAERLAGRQDPVAVQARAVVGLVQEGIAQTRQIARGLLLANVSPERLPSELEELAKTAKEQHRLECRFTLDGTLRFQDPSVASQLYWIAQEAVRNAVRHGRPTHISIDLRTEENWIILTVEDDGVGLGASGHALPGIGLKIMANRAQLVGGDLVVSPVSNHGTRVICRVPAVEYEEFAIV